MQAHTYYRMTHMLRRSPARRDQEWTTFDHARYNISLQVGATVGILGITFHCPCGEQSTIDYFFHVKDDDHVFGRCMRPTVVDDSRIRLVLPNRQWGIFQKAAEGDGFDDAYIHDLAVSCNARRPSENTLRRFFRTIFERVVLKRRVRHAFDRLYFRCYRKAFAPTGRAAQRARLDFEQDV